MDEFKYGMLPAMLRCLESIMRDGNTDANRRRASKLLRDQFDDFTLSLAALREFVKVAGPVMKDAASNAERLSSLEEAHESLRAAYNDTTDLLHTYYEENRRLRASHGAYVSSDIWDVFERMMQRSEEDQQSFLKVGRAMSKRTTNGTVEQAARWVEGNLPVLAGHGQA